MAEKTFTDYVAEILELLPTLISTGLSLQQAISWGIGKIRGLKGGGVPTDQDWADLAAFRALKKPELRANVERLLAQG